MKKFIIIGDVYPVKDALKRVKPKKAWQHWKFNPDKKYWEITLQTTQSTKTFEKRLAEFADKNNLSLNHKEWDGFNKENNYK